MSVSLNLEERQLKKKIGKEVSRILGHFKKWPVLYKEIKENMVLTGHSIYSIAHGSKNIIDVRFKTQKSLSVFESYAFSKEFKDHFKYYNFTIMAENLTWYDEGVDFFFHPSKNLSDMVTFNLRDTCDGLKSLSNEVETFKRCYFDLSCRELYIDRPDLFYRKEYTHIDDSVPQVDWVLVEIFTGFHSTYVP